MNSMGYVEKSAEKWQKAVSDWKGKVRAKAAGIKLELSKTGGGGAGLLQLTETEKRLIGVMGWTSIRGDGTLQLGSPSKSTSIDTSELQIGMEHDYQFQVVPPKIRNVALSPPPLIHITETNNINERILTDSLEAPSIPVPVERTKKKRKLIRKPTNWHGKNNLALESMHEETLTILKDINYNIKKLGDAQERLCDIHTKILDQLTQQNIL